MTYQQFLIILISIQFGLYLWMVFNYLKMYSKAKTYLLDIEANNKISEFDIKSMVIKLKDLKCFIPFFIICALAGVADGSTFFCPWFRFFMQLSIWTSFLFLLKRISLFGNFILKNNIKTKISYNVFKSIHFIRKYIAIPVSCLAVLVTLLAHTSVLMQTPNMQLNEIAKAPILYNETKKGMIDSRYSGLENITILYMSWLYENSDKSKPESKENSLLIFALNNLKSNSFALNLIKSGADPFHEVVYKNLIKESAFDNIVAQGKTKLLEAVITKYPNIKLEAKKREQIAQYALASKKLKILEQLVSAKIINNDLETTKGDEDTLIMTLLRSSEINNESEEIIKLLIKNGADINQKLVSKNQDGMSALHFAASQLGPKEIDFLVDQGANIDLHDTKNQSPLVYAIEAKK